jgi:hypothetical protein
MCIGWWMSPTKCTTNRTAWRFENPSIAVGESRI